MLERQLSLFDALAGAAVVSSLRAGLGVSHGPGPAISAFEHPQAQREICLNEHRVAYVLRRRRRRSIGFVVDAQGLSVAAPAWIGLAEIESALREKAGWIVRKLDEQNMRQQRVQQAKVQWRDGTRIPYLGLSLVVVLDPHARAARGDGLLSRDSAALPQASLHLALAHSATPEQIGPAVQSWLQRQARQVFEARCRHFAPLLGVNYQRLSLSSARTRWGSANAKGSIRLNWRLIHFSMDTLDYVVVHELAHLIEMNHSPRFWSLVRSVLPDYERARRALRDDVLPVFD